MFRSRFECLFPVTLLRGRSRRSWRGAPPRWASGTTPSPAGGVFTFVCRATTHLIGASDECPLSLSPPHGSSYDHMLSLGVGESSNDPPAAHGHLDAAKNRTYWARPCFRFVLKIVSFKTRVTHVSLNANWCMVVSQHSMQPFPFTACISAPLSLTL